MEERPQRIARNESAYRQVNEAIEAGRETRDADVPRPFMCECGLLECNTLVELTLGEYEAVRADPHRFFMLDGHEIPDVESVVERHERFIVAEKHPESHAITEREDPRRDER